MGDLLKKRLLEVTLLLVGVRIFYATVAFVPYVIPLESTFGTTFLELYPWLGNVIFALVLLPQVWKTSPKIALAVCLLCAIEPVFGGMIYLIVTTSFQFKVDQWFIDLLD